MPRAPPRLHRTCRTSGPDVQLLVQPAGSPFDFWIDDVSFILQ